MVSVTLSGWMRAVAIRDVRRTGDIIPACHRAKGSILPFAPRMGRSQAASVPTVGRKSRPRGLLLDFYGTLVEEDHATTRRICAEIAACSRAAVDDVQRAWDRAFLHLRDTSFGDEFCRQEDIQLRALETVIGERGCDYDVASAHRALTAYWRKPRLYQATRAFLERPPLPLCVVSNADRDSFYAAWDALELPPCPAITSEDARSYKPRPEMFQAALELLGLEAHEVLHIGDSFNSDVQGAKALGIPVLWLNRTRAGSRREPKPEFEGTSLTALSWILA